jgi:hypothetical protein
MSTHGGSTSIDPLRHPALSKWIDSRAGHPLADPQLLPAFVDSYEHIVAPLVKAAPRKLATRRKAFRAASTLDDLLEQRAELLIAALLLDAGLLDAFGDPHPDLVCCSGALGLEVGTRWKDDVRLLHDRLEDRLTRDGHDITVHLEFSEKPLAIGEQGLSRIVERVAVAAWSLDEAQSMRFEGAALRVDLTPATPGEGARVVWATGFELDGHMAEAQREIANILQRKEHQARSMDTILLIDISRVGQSWLRPPANWQRALDAVLAPSDAFAGLGVFFSPIDGLGREGALSLRGTASERTRAAGRNIAHALNLYMS